MDTKPRPLISCQKSSGYIRVRGAWRYNSSSLHARINRRAGLCVGGMRTEVVAYGTPNEHKVRAILEDGTWLTYYVNTGVVNLHCPERGGLGRGEYARPEVLGQLREGYRAAV